MLWEEAENIIGPSSRELCEAGTRPKCCVYTTLQQPPDIPQDSCCMLSSQFEICGGRGWGKLMELTKAAEGENFGSRPWECVLFGTVHKESGSGICLLRIVDVSIVPHDKTLIGPGQGESHRSPDYYSAGDTHPGKDPPECSQGVVICASKGSRPSCKRLSESQALHLYSLNPPPASTISSMKCVCRSTGCWCLVGMLPRYWASTGHLAASKPTRCMRQ